MQSKTNDSRLAMILTTGIVLVSFCATAIAAITGWVPNALGHTGNGPAPARIEWSRMNAKPLVPVAAHPAYFTAPARPIQVNATTKVTKE
jgi:hypothetical protein